MSEFRKIGIIGIGLIGGSIGIEIKKRKVADHVIGYSRKLETMEKAVKRGIIDRYFTNPEEVISEADFLILTTPIGVLKEYFRIIKKVKPDIFFTDVASVKKNVCDSALKILGSKSNFIGSHPIAGSEKSGIDAARESLFENKVIILTPTKWTKRKAKEITKKFWENLGGKVIFMTPENHDKILGFTSHLPHFLVYVLLSLGNKFNSKIMKNCFGTGFLDTTRIGKSECNMWVEIFENNKKNLNFWISLFEKEMKEFKKTLNKNNSEKLLELLKQGKSFREKIE